MPTSKEIRSAIEQFTNSQFQVVDDYIRINENYQSLVRFNKLHPGVLPTDAFLKFMEIQQHMIHNYHRAVTYLSDAIHSSLTTLAEEKEKEEAEGS